MTDWGGLQDAEGSADSIPDLLDRLTPNSSDLWERLWARLCPQGAVFPASLAALPYLSDLAARWAPEERVEPLLLAGAILGSDEQYHQVFDVRDRYSAQISVLRELTDDTLRTHAASKDSANYVYLLQALMAFEGVDVWDSHLENLVTEEYEISCPSCDVDLFIVLGDPDCFATHQDYALKDDVISTPLRSADPGELSGAPGLLHRTAVRDGCHAVARRLTYLFGTATCSQCGTGLPIAERVAAAFGRDS
ncbi:hypothetical protein E1264_03945 [Actinomadura sp. KC216]|uniref:hypothetical protein n=1 Tax=Actinomadura sp. KC216 TaxID=2530370 RepID=UPI0010476ABE|nr:hypothetical protein [Actinomadura sp. KC216]TDB90771.1 hypothetical protein E1264_03945 [Actinomadura sp. KC216]